MENIVGDDFYMYLTELLSIVFDNICKDVDVKLEYVEYETFNHIYFKYGVNLDDMSRPIGKLPPMHKCTMNNFDENVNTCNAKLLLWSDEEKCL